MVKATAPGKAILLGEHAVVYGRPALAVPLRDLRAEACVEGGARGGGVRIAAHDLGAVYTLGDDSRDDAGRALQATVRNALQQWGIPQGAQALRIGIHSQVPPARGLGSGTAVNAALVRALAAYYRRVPSPDEISELVYRTEIILHGTPSGIDNTVVAWEQPIWFQRDREAEVLRVGAPLCLLIADTGVPSKTSDTVAAVRAGRQADRARYEALFDAMGACAHAAREALAVGDLERLGGRMTANHQLLQRLGVSHPALDALVGAALAAGALGAKLSGGGGGGCGIALLTGGDGADAERADAVADALRRAGATAVWRTGIA